MSLSTKSVITDEYRYESVNEHSYQRVPIPIKYYTPTFSSHRFMPTRLFYNTAPVYYEPKIEIKLEPRVTEIRIEKMPLTKSNSFVSIAETTKSTIEEADNCDYKYKYEYIEEINKKPISKVFSKSSSNISDMKSLTKPNSASFAFDHDQANKQRHVSFFKHTDDDSGLSLAGSLVKASPAYLPVNRSVHIGPIFNGSSYGILCNFDQLLRSPPHD